MPTVRVEMYTGRTREQKAELAEAITEVVVNIAKTTSEATQVVFYDVPKSDWAIGGKLSDE